MIIASVGYSLKLIRGRVGGQGATAATAGQSPVSDKHREQALQVYKELAKDKLDVVKTALAMGYKDDDIARLDARLESLVGQDKLAELIHGSGPEVLANADLLDTQLDNELQRLKQSREAQ
jgi:hypothetical protein